MFTHEMKKFGLDYALVHEIRKNILHKRNISDWMNAKRGRYFSRMTNEQLLVELNDIYNQVMGRQADLSHPKTWTEKIQWIKIMDASELKSKLADKIQVKKWVADKIGEKYVIPMISKGGCNKFADLDFDSLPDKFVIKMNNGCGMNYPVTDKKTMDILDVKKKVNKWLKSQYCWDSLEMQYRGIENQVFVEKYIEEITGNLYDYKFQCFHGKPYWIECIGDRNLFDHTGAQQYFDTEWRKLDWSDGTYPLIDHEVPKPEHFDEMLEIAGELSKDFNFVRVDLYDVGRVLFGEMTFTPASGLIKYNDKWNYKKDLEIGALLTL